MVLSASYCHAFYLKDTSTYRIKLRIKYTVHNLSIFNILYSHYAIRISIEAPLS